MVGKLLKTLGKMALKFRKSVCKQYTGTSFVTMTVGKLDNMSTSEGMKMTLQLQICDLDC